MIDQVCQYLDSLTDIELLCLCYHFGINDRGVHLTIPELSRGLQVNRSTVEASLSRATQKLLSYPDILKALENHTDE